jgi:hypothetical protein
MKKIFTLAAASVLAAGSLTAQAQVVLDGQLTAPEVTAGNYTLLGKYTNPRGFGDAGLLSLYAASTPTKLYIFVGGTVEANGNAFQLFLDLPGVTGVPVGTSLPNGTATTSFQNVAFKLDLAADVALALRSDTSPNYKIEGANYIGATVNSKNLTTSATPLVNAGAPITLDGAATTGTGYGLLAGTRVAYKVFGAGGVALNPGNTSPNTGASYGGVGSYGWEIEIDRANAGLTGTSPVSLFVVQNGGDGGYASSDYIPQTSAPLAGNNGNPGTGAYDFTAVPDLQAATYTPVAAVLAAKAADAAAVGINVFPNPANGRAIINYNVAGTSEQVSVVLSDLMGRQVRVLENAAKSAGKQSVSLSTTDVAAGTYLVRVQVGEKVATRKVVLL